MHTALCVGRHRYLSEHLGTYFRSLGLTTTCVVGIDEALHAAQRELPDLVLCDYDLLATVHLDAWERDERLSRVPLIAVSLTRRPEEVHLLDINAIAGFLYLPTLDVHTARRALGLGDVRTPGWPAPPEWSRPSVRV